RLVAEVFDGLLDDPASSAQRGWRQVRAPVAHEPILDRRERRELHGALARALGDVLLIEPLAEERLRGLLRVPALLAVPLAPGVHVADVPAGEVAASVGSRKPLNAACGTPSASRHRCPPCVAARPKIRPSGDTLGSWISS